MATKKTLSERLAELAIEVENVEGANEYLEGELKTLGGLVRKAENAAEGVGEALMKLDGALSGISLLCSNE